MATRTLVWGHHDLKLTFEWDQDTPVRLNAVRVGGRDIELRDHVPFVQILTAADGRARAGTGLTETSTGRSLRYRGHAIGEAAGPGLLVTGVPEPAEASPAPVTQTRAPSWTRLDIHLFDPVGGLEVTVHLESPHGVAALRSRVTVRQGAEGASVLLAVPSWSSTLPLGPDPLDASRHVSALESSSDWLGEGRWTLTPLRDRLADVSLAAHPTDGRTPWSRSSAGTWSSGSGQPIGGVVPRLRPDGSAQPSDAVATLWQIEHNGPWRWEITDRRGGPALVLSGPTDRDAGWSLPLQPGQEFSSVPVSLAFGRDAEDALSALQQHRRRSRRAHAQDKTLPLVFNDYMNTLMGDPTTEKLLPLVDAAGAAGAEYFCIDAGWYDDGGDWWPSVGEWMPSTQRFPRGLAEVIDRIRDRGMVPGLWLEPEVIGVQSPLTRTLPDDAFLQRHGVVVAEHLRRHLDLRHPAARAHLDAVVDRLVGELGIGYFKLDYNIDPGPGTDRDAASPGDGLLQHNRAHLDWLDGVRDRHPELVLENCGSGAMRSDFALLSRMALQSTSDQQDALAYPPIAAAAPLGMTPEQAGSWAYPHRDMNAEETAFTLATGILGRLYLSGHLNEMGDEQRDLVHEAVAAHKRVRSAIPRAQATFPLGLPEWESRVVATALVAESEVLATVWRRDPWAARFGSIDAATSTTLHFPHLRDREVSISTLFPVSLPAWRSEWDPRSATLTLQLGDEPVAARMLRITTTPNPSEHDHGGARAEPKEITS